MITDKQFYAIGAHVDELDEGYDHPVTDPDLVAKRAHALELSRQEPFFTENFYPEDLKDDWEAGDTTEFPTFQAYLDDMWNPEYWVHLGHGIIDGVEWSFWCNPADLEASGLLLMKDTSDDTERLETWSSV